MKYRRMIWCLCVLVLTTSAKAAPLVRPQPAIPLKKALSQKQQELLYRAFGAIWIDSDLDDVDIEADVRAALDAGISPNARNEHGDTLLLQAVENGRVSIVRILLRCGANPNLKSLRFGDAPLRRILDSASANDDADALTIFRMLLQRKAIVDVRDSNGLTPLMHAIAEGHDKIVEMLLKAGADFKLRGKYGGTALWLARSPIYVGGGVASAEYPSMPLTPEGKNQLQKRLQAYRSLWSDHPKMVGTATENYERVEAERTQRGRIRIVRLLRRAGARE
jgi:hypothetical protein